MRKCYPNRKIQYRSSTAIAIAFLSFAMSVSTFATEPEHEGAGEHSEEHRKHALGLFVGVTREHSENLETFGIEYSYRVNEKWSVGGVVERADRDKHSTLLIVFAHYWPYKGLYLGPGLGTKDPGDERENTVRGTIGYEFEVGKGWGISPQVNIDWIENHPTEEVFGIVIAKRF